MRLNSYVVKYKDMFSENKFNRLLSSLKTYNMVAYKQFIFEFLPSIKNGNLLGVKKNDLYYYELYSDRIFKLVHGKINVIYSVKDNDITLITITPTEVLYQGSMRLLDTYKGTVYLSESDKFKIDLIKTIGGDK